ncbi:MAG: DUF4350 domain-containing protein [Thermoplasmatota archaeon]
MNHSLRRFYTLSALVVVVAGLVTVALLQPIVGTRTDFSIYNAQWNGSSEAARDLYGMGNLLPTFAVSLEEGNTTVVQRSFADFSVDARSTSLVLIGPGSAPDAAEAAWLAAFVHRGGRVLIADDFGKGNTFLAAMGASSRFDGGLLADLSFMKAPAFVVAANFTPDPVTDGLHQIVLDDPTALRVGANTTVLATTDTSSWIDTNRDGVLDGQESAASRVWLARERVGAGEVLLVSDPSVFINAMRPYGDDARFVHNAVAWLTEGGRKVLVDESHHDYTDPLKLLGATLRPMPTALRLGLAFGAAAIFLLLVSGRASRVPASALAAVRRAASWLLPEPKAPETDLVAAVKRRHPDWDEKTLRDVLRRWSET